MQQPLPSYESFYTWTVIFWKQTYQKSIFSQWFSDQSSTKNILIVDFEMFINGLNTFISSGGQYKRVWASMWDRCDSESTT